MQHENAAITKYFKTTRKYIAEAQVSHYDRYYSKLGHLPKDKRAMAAKELGKAAEIADANPSRENRAAEYNLARKHGAHTDESKAAKLVARLIEDDTTLTLNLLIA